MKFKELELEETRSKCKRIEAAVSPCVPPQVQRRPVPDVSPPNRSKFLNRTLFETSSVQSERKKPPTTTEAEVQTCGPSWSEKKSKRFRLCNSDPNHSDPSDLIHSLIYSLKSVDTGKSNRVVHKSKLKHWNLLTESSSCRQAVDLMSEVRMRLNAADWMEAEASQWKTLLSNNGTQMVELVCERLHQIKVIFHFCLRNCTTFDSGLFPGHWMVRIIHRIHGVLDCERFTCFGQVRNEDFVILRDL